MTEGAIQGGLRGRKAQWRIEEPIPSALRQDLGGYSPMLCHLLYCRGYRTRDAIAAFFDEPMVVHDPYLLADMDAAVRSIARAVERGDSIAVYGDFDCDGITSAALLAFALGRLGADPIVEIPSRVDGHGLHPEVLAGLSDRGVQMVITADCGITAIDEVEVAHGLGIEVVITDHHEPRPDGTLPACPTVAPTRLDSIYPCRYLCGVGVAYKLAQALHLSLPGAPDPDAWLDLVALGTIADVVQMRDENRTLVIRGLEALQKTQRPGLQALFEVAGVQADRIDPVSVSYYLAPRINAANRMASPQLAYDLITAADRSQAMDLARSLSVHNSDRQLLVAEHFERIVEELGPPEMLLEDVIAGRRAPLLMVVGTWPGGLSGLLASRLVDTYGLPAFVGTETESGVVSVSARSVPGIAVDELLEGCEAALPGGLFLGYGGHSGAGGFRVPAERLGTVEELLDAEARREISVADIGSVLTIDATLSPHQLTLGAAQQLKRMAPFGIGFPEPLFLLRNVTPAHIRPLSGGKHARFSLKEGGPAGVAFGVDPEFFTCLGRPVDLVFHLEVDEWEGRAKAQIRVRDWRLVP